MYFRSRVFLVARESLYFRVSSEDLCSSNFVGADWLDNIKIVENIRTESVQVVFWA